MYELAVDRQGLPIALPPEATKFLVRKHRNKKSPRVLFRNGQRVVVPVDTAARDLHELLRDESGRFRLLALDEEDNPVPDVPEAYFEVDEDDDEDDDGDGVAARGRSAAFSLPNTTRHLLATHPREALLLETMRANTEITRAMIERLPDILKAGAQLITAADGAGMPRRRPPIITIDDDDDTAEVAAPAPEAAGVLTTVLQAAASGGNLGGLLALIGNKSAVPTSAGTPPVSGAAMPAVPEMPRNAACNVPRPADPQAHLTAILGQLSADERAYAERVVVQLSPAAVKQWHELLLSMSVDAAAAMIRAKAAGKAPEGGPATA